MKAKPISKKKGASKATAVTKGARKKGTGKKGTGKKGTGKKGTGKKGTRKSKPATTPVGDIMRNAAEVIRSVAKNIRP